MSDIEIYDPPREGLVDAEIIGYIPATEEYLVKIGDNPPTQIPVSKVSVQPDDYIEYDDDDDAYEAWEGSDH